MLIRFRAENFRSIKDGQELSLVASNLDEPVGKIAPMLAGKLDLLCATAIYGSNASGKTNVIDALESMNRIILYSQTKWEGREGIPYSPFHFDSVSKKKPTRFEVDILLNNVRYQYGFSINKKIILEETLYAYPMGKPQLWFERKSHKKTKFKFGKNLTGENKTIQKLTRPNSLFLSAAAQNNHPQLSLIYEWFLNRVSFISSAYRDEQDTLRKITNDEVSATDIIEFLKLADLGICDIDFSEWDKNSKKEMSGFRKGLAELLKEHVSKEIGEEFATDKNFFKTVKLVHLGNKGKTFSLDLQKESHGTQTLFSLIGPILYAAKTGGLVVIDELENGMHPILARRLVNFFNSEITNPKNAQLIFTTHSTNLLREGLFRRDQVWFTEKDQKGRTHLYPLTDFKPRKTENIERGYLQGRFGAVPFLGNFDFLIHKERKGEARKKAKASRKS